MKRRISIIIIAVLLVNVATAGIFKGYTSIKGLIKQPAARFAEAYTVTNKIDNIIIKDANYEAKLKAIEKYFAKDKKQINRFYMSKIEVKKNIETGELEFLINGEKVIRDATKSGGFIYKKERNLYVGKGTTSISLKTIKGDTAEGLAEIQTKLLQGNVREAEFYFGNVGNTNRKAYYIEIEMRNNKVNKYLLDTDGSLREVTKGNYHIIGPKNLEPMQIGKVQK